MAEHNITELCRGCESCRVLAATLLSRLNQIEGRFLVGGERSCYAAGVNIQALRRELEEGIRSER
jgi:hypothetical protein